MRTKDESLKFLEQEEVRDWIGYLQDNLPNYNELWEEFQACGSNEAQAVRQNEDAKDICDCSQAKGVDLDEDGYPYCIECQKYIRAN